jgi:putative oxidoreductase
MWKTLLSTGDQQWGTLPLRLALGLIFLAHGGQKLFGWLGGKGLAGTAGFFAGKLGLEPGMLWALLAGLGEFGGGLLLLLGLFTRLGAFMVALIMLVAIFKVHWGVFFMPTGMEFAFALFAMALALLIIGGGKFSLDARLQKRGRQGE